MGGALVVTVAVLLGAGVGVWGDQQPQPQPQPRAVMRQDFKRVNDSNAVPGGPNMTVEKTAAGCEALCGSHPACLQWTWNMASHHCFRSTSASWSPTFSDHCSSGCRPELVPGCGTRPRPPVVPRWTATRPRRSERLAGYDSLAVAFKSSVHRGEPGQGSYNHNVFIDYQVSRGRHRHSRTTLYVYFVWRITKEIYRVVHERLHRPRPYQVDTGFVLAWKNGPARRGRQSHLVPIAIRMRSKTHTITAVVLARSNRPGNVRPVAQGPAGVQGAYIWGPGRVRGSWLQGPRPPRPPRRSQPGGKKHIST
jgi:hypothetical protein